MRKYITISIILLFVFSFMPKGKTKEMPIEQNKIMNELEEPIIEKKESTLNNTYTIQERNQVQEQINTINLKFEIVNKVIGKDYKNMNILNSQIQQLNIYIQENSDLLTKEKKLQKNILKNLKVIDSSLNKLLKLFNINLNKNNFFYEVKGKITKINKKYIIIQNKTKKIKVNISKKTLKKTPFYKNDFVTIKYSDITNNKDYMEITKCLYIAVDNYLL